MTTLQLLEIMRAILHNRTENWYPILEANTLLQGMDEIELDQDEGKLKITLTLYKSNPMATLLALKDVYNTEAE